MPRPSPKRWRARTRGAVIVEYAIVLTAVAVPFMAGLLFAGVELADHYVFARAQVLRATP